MLLPAWEEYATQFANAATMDALMASISEVITKEKIDVSQSATVVVGRDTRYKKNFPFHVRIHSTIYCKRLLESTNNR